MRERILEFIAFSGLSPAEFERSCGLSNGAVSKMGDNTRRSTIDKISNTYPLLNPVWLLTGEGEMLLSDKKPTEVTANANANMIPLINIDSVGGVWSGNSIDVSEQYVDRMIPIPDARPEDCAIFQSGDSMLPQIPSGAILHIRRVVDWNEYIGYGDVFVILLTDGRRITKQIIKSEEDPKNYILCRSFNEDCADEELPRRIIREVWKVVNVLVNRGW